MSFHEKVGRSLLQALMSFVCEPYCLLFLKIFEFQLQDSQCVVHPGRFKLICSTSADNLPDRSPVKLLLIIHAVPSLSRKSIDIGREFGENRPQRRECFVRIRVVLDGTFKDCFVSPSFFAKVI